MTGPAKSQDFQSLVSKLAHGQSLSGDEAAAAFETIMSGEASDGQIGAFLMALALNGESVSDITAGAKVLRAKAVGVTAPQDVIDTCGTGGDAKGTYNISTAAAFVVAGCGVKVAKHGNRAASSKSGSAEVLEQLGVRLDVTPDQVSKAIGEAGIGFLMAPRHHMAMKHVAAVRRELGFRTVFNVLGPLSNPAGARRQLLGVFDPKWLTPLAEVLRNLGAEHVWVVHGSDGLDELTTTGPSHVAALENGAIETFEVTPEDAGLPRARLEDIRGGDPAENARALKALLEGEKGPYRDIVVLNAAAALIVAGRARTLEEGTGLAQISIDEGRAANALDGLAAICAEETP